MKGCFMAEIMTTEEVSKYLSLHKIAIYKLAAGGEIPAIRIGRIWRFDKKAIDKWKKSQKTGNRRRKVILKKR
jgi:excisionase family DNA binding protein